MAGRRDGFKKRAKLSRRRRADGIVCSAAAIEPPRGTERENFMKVHESA